MWKFPWANRLDVQCLSCKKLMIKVTFLVPGLSIAHGWGTRERPSCAGRSGLALLCVVAFVDGQSSRTKNQQLWPPAPTICKSDLAESSTLTGGDSWKSLRILKFRKLYPGISFPPADGRQGVPPKSELLEFLFIFLLWDLCVSLSCQSGLKFGCRDSICKYWIWKKP